MRRGGFIVFVRLAFVSILASFLVAGSSLADVLDDPDPDFSLRDTLAVGPFHVAPFFFIRDLGYDDNVRLGTAETVDDFTLTLGPGARAVMPLGHRGALSFWDEMDFALYATQTDLNTVNNTLRAKGHYYLRDTIAFLEGEQRNFRQRPNNEIDFRIRDITTQARMGGRYRPEGRLGADLSIIRTDFHYELGDIEIPEEVDEEDIVLKATASIRRLERTETGARVGGRLKLRPRTTLLLDVEQADIDFQYLTVPARRNSLARSAMLGLEFDPSGGLKGFIKAGLKDLEPDSDLLLGYHGFIADAEVSARLGGRGDLKATYVHNTGFSSMGDNLYYILDRKGLGYEHFINQRLSLGLEQVLSEYEYPVDLQGQISTHRTDDITETRAQVRYRFGPTLRLGLRVSQWRRDSTIDSEDEDRTTATVLMEYKP